MEEYPYFILPYLEEYRQVDPNSERGKKLCRLLALNIGDKAALRRVLGIEPPELGTCFEEETKDSSSFDTIDTFLAKFKGTKTRMEYEVGGSEHESENMNYELPSIEEGKSSPEEARASEEHMKTSETETRAKLKELVKTHRYQEAIDFIESQNLINPKKNIYFADQIRFLKRLIDLEKQKN